MQRLQREIRASARRPRRRCARRRRWRRWASSPAASRTTSTTCCTASSARSTCCRRAWRRAGWTTSTAITARRMTSAKRAAALTHRLLAFSRRQPLDPKPVDANRLVAPMEDLLRRTLGETSRSRWSLAGGLWTTLCDPQPARERAAQPRINARDAMPDGGKLTIETCNAHLDERYAARERDVPPGQYVCICVTDTGTGMPPDVIAKAFDPFFTTKPIGQGTGLGLSMIYGFARSPSGHVKIYSEVGTGHDGQALPAAPPRRGGAPRTAAAAAPAAPAAEQGETVLVVEDEPVGARADHRRAARARLPRAGGRRRRRGAADPAVRRARSTCWSPTSACPGLNGRQLADAARGTRPDLKVLFMTGYAENAASQRLPGAGHGDDHQALRDGAAGAADPRDAQGQVRTGMKRAVQRRQVSSSVRSASSSAGLIRWWSKPASRARARSSCLAPAGQRDQRGPRRCGCARRRARDLVAVHAGHADVQQHHVGRERRAQPPARRRRRATCAPAWPCSSQQHAPALSAASALSSTTSTRDGRARPASVAACRGSAPRRRGAARQRQAHRERRCPGRGPSLSRAQRAAMHARPGCATSARPMPRPPWRGRASRRPARTARRRAPASRGAMPMPLSRTRTHGLVALRPRTQRDAAAAGRVLGGVVQQVGQHLREARRVARRSRSGSAGSARSAAWPPLSISGRLVSTRVCDAPRASATGSLAQLQLAAG